ncbi:glycosyltransferase family 2 protein [Alkalihalophilus sp. As8PL]|uniref:Glycosyltransferase family 2 protein n=1 Tax=Alkalihalophilus sp. As8PL TaxID=3237103 RepID=A0AB39BQB0_9BACI
MISVIIPTLGERPNELQRLFTSFAYQSSQSFEVIVVSQANHQTVSDLLRNVSFSSKHITLEKRGLSYARNQGLLSASGEILTFSDDDCWYPQGAFEKAGNHFVNSDEPILCFQIYDFEEKQYYKTYPVHDKRLSWRDVFKKSSIEMFFKRSELNMNLVKFDEDFGLGAKYPSGEENLLLLKLYRAGYRMRYVPEIIVYHKKPTIQSRLTEQALISKGPLLKKMFNTPIGFSMLTYFFLKKYSHLERPLTLYKHALRELRQYKVP